MGLELRVHLIIKGKSKDLIFSGVTNWEMILTHSLVVDWRRLIIKFPSLKQTSSLMPRNRTTITIDYEQLIF